MNPRAVVIALRPLTGRLVLPTPWWHHPVEGRPSSASVVEQARALYLRWRGREVRIRHDDPLLSRYSAVVQRLQSALTITTEVPTLRLVMARERAYDVQVLDDGSEVRLRRRA